MDFIYLALSGLFWLMIFALIQGFAQLHAKESQS